MIRVECCIAFIIPTSFSNLITRINVSSRTYTDAFTSIKLDVPHGLVSNNASKHSISGLGPWIVNTKYLTIYRDYALGAYACVLT